MSEPICPFCNKEVRKTSRECPQCHIKYHPNCWQQIRFCLTCSCENTDQKDESSKRGKRSRTKAKEAVTFDHEQFFKQYSNYFVIPGSTIPILSIFLFLFRSSSFFYLELAFLGAFLYIIGYGLNNFTSCKNIVSPSTKSIRREITILGLKRSYKLLSFDEIASFRLEGFQNFKGDQKGVPSYFYNAFHVVVITKHGLHIPLSNDIRTDKDSNFIIGEEYEFAGLLPLAKKAGETVGVEVYIAPNIQPFRLFPLFIKTALISLILLFIGLFL